MKSKMIYLLSDLSFSMFVPFRAVQESDKVIWKACTTLCHWQLRSLSG